MAARARLYRNGGSQAVRLPKAVRFSGEMQEVLVHRVGRRVILEPADEWPAEFVKCLGAWDEEIDRPEAEPVTKPRDPFK